MDLPEVVDTKRIFSGRMIGVRVDQVRMNDGAIHTREIVEYGLAVVLVPLDASGDLLMVRQYRHPARKWLLELPAGGVEPDEPLYEAAQRELREETGHRGRLTRIGGMYLAPGYSEEYQHIFLAEDLVEDALDADEDEDLTLERVPLEQALRFIDDGTICDAKSIAALMMYLRHAASPSRDA